MINFLKKRWFLVCLVLAIPMGILLGTAIPGEYVESFDSSFMGSASRYLVAFVLFLMSVTLDIHKLTAAMKAPAPVIWACLVNFTALPILAIQLSKYQLTPDFAAGIIISASAPSTMASASVWTRKANGNDAVSLLGTIVTNGLCFLITPFWLSQGLGDGVTLDTLKMIERLFYTALVPIAIGQAVRLSQPVKKYADEKKSVLSSLALICLLGLIVWASVKGGRQLQGSENTSTITLGPVLVVWGSCLFVHVIGLLLAFYGGQLLNFRREDIVAVVFSASQKTLPIGIYVATDLLADRNLPFAAFPILMFHATQLILDTLLIDPLGNWVEKEKTDADEA